MAIVNSFDHLLKNSPRLKLGEPLFRVRFNMTMERASPNIFHDQKHIFLSINGLNHINYVRILDLLHQFNFSSNWFLSIDVNKFMLFINLHCYFIPCQFMQTYSHHCIRPLTNLLPYDVFFNWSFIRVIGIRIFCKYYSVCLNSLLIIYFFSLNCIFIFKYFWEKGINFWNLQFLSLSRVCNF